MSVTKSHGSIKLFKAARSQARISVMNNHSNDHDEDEDELDDDDDDVEVDDEGSGDSRCFKGASTIHVSCSQR